MGKIRLENLLLISSRILVIFGIFGVAFFSFNFIKKQAVAAIAPSVVTYQGKLLVSNSPASTTVSMKFVLYDDLTTGSALYTASGTVGAPAVLSITPTSGLFSIDLGGSGTNALDPSIFQSTSTIYLEVTVGIQTLSPRKQITAAPYAFNAKYIDGLATSSLAKVATDENISGAWTFSATTSLATTTISSTTISTANITTGNLETLTVAGTSTLTNLEVSGYLSLPANSVTDAMIPDTITASNYLSLNTWTGTTTLPSNILLSVLTQVGTITTGTWHGTAIDDAYISNSITASNYLLLAGGTISGDLTVNGITDLATTTATGLTISQNGLILTSATPAVTTNALYNQSGVLYWNGSQVGSGVGSSASWSTTSYSNLGFTPTNTPNIGFGSDGTDLWIKTEASGAAVYIDSNSRVGIGTTTPNKTLTVVGSISNIFDSNSGFSVLSTTDILTGVPTSIYVAGNYAYITSADTVSIFDISNPAIPVEVGSTTYAGSYALTVSGKYAYVASESSGANHGIAILDISNPSSPLVISSYTANCARSIALSGRYLFWGNNCDGGGSQALDLLGLGGGSLVTGGGSAVTSIIPMAAKGHYLYTAPNNGTNLKVFDISTVGSDMFPVSTASVGSSPSAIYISGDYAYVTNQDSNTVSVIDISDPLLPTSAATIAVGSAPKSIYVSGRYAYVANSGSGSITIIDVSVPTAASVVGVMTIGGSPYGISVSGRYGYVVNYSSNTLSILDLTGAEFSTMVAHSAGIGQLQVSDDISAQSISTRELRVGANGIFSDGALIINATNTNSYFSGGITVSGTVEAYGLSISGDGSFSGTLSANDISAGDSLVVSGNATTTGNQVISGNLNVTGTTTLATTTISSTTITTANVTTLNAGDLNVSGNSSLGSVISASGNISLWTNNANYLTSYTESDPIWIAASSSFVRWDAASTTFWDTAYGWGNHALASYLTSYTESDPIWNAASSSYLTIVGATSIYLPLSGGTISGDLTVSGNATTTGNQVISGNLNVTGISTLATTTISGRLGIGTTTPDQALTVVGSISNPLNTNSGAVQVGSVAVGSSTFWVTVSGKYAYVTNNVSGTVSVVDVTRPDAPVEVTSTSVSGAPYGIVVSGRYAYVGSGTSDVVSVLDIANPTAPVVVATTSVSGLPGFVAVRGRYLYVSTYTGRKLVVMDISNPLAPTVIGSADGILNQRSIAFSGHYAYVAGGNSDAGLIGVFDISNPTAPVLVATTTAGLIGFDIAISGRYAYVASALSQTLEVINISNPLAPTSTASLVLSGGAYSVFLAGKYAYLASPGDNSLSIVNISNPVTPFLAVTTTVGSLPNSVFVSGRYAYVANYGSATLSVVDLSGAEFSTLMAHSAEVGNIQSRNDIIAQGIVGANSLQVGVGGILSNGSIAVTVTDTSTFGGSINVTSGCLAISGVCLSNGTTLNTTILNVSSTLTTNSTTILVGNNYFNFTGANIGGNDYASLSIGNGASSTNGAVAIWGDTTVGPRFMLVATTSAPSANVGNSPFFAVDMTSGYARVDIGSTGNAKSGLLRLYDNAGVNKIYLSASSTDGDSFVLDNFLVGANSESIANTGFVLTNNNSLYTEGDLGVNGNIYTDGAIYISGTSTLAIVNVSGNTILSGALNVNGLSTLTTTTASRLYLTENGTATGAGNVYLTERPSAAARRIMMYGNPYNSTFGFVVGPTGMVKTDTSISLWSTDADGGGVANYGAIQNLGSSGSSSLRFITGVVDDDLGDIIFYPLSHEMLRISSKNNLISFASSISTSSINLSFATSTNFLNTVGSFTSSTAFIFNATSFVSTSADRYILSLRSNGTAVFSVSANGDIRGNKLWATDAAIGSPGTPGDLAEKVDIAVDDIAEAGDVVVVDPNGIDTYRRSSEAYSQSVAGVISTNPTITVGNGKTSNTAVMAMVGRVPVKVSGENGAIKRGDLLVSASLPGYAMKYNPEDDNGLRMIGIVGVALDNFDGVSTTGKIMALIRTGWVNSRGQTINNIKSDLETLAQSQGVNINSDPDNLTIQSDGSNLVYSGGSLNLDGNGLVGVSAITGVNGRWEINADGWFITRVDTTSGQKEMYGLQSPAAEFVFSSSSQLMNGEARVTFDVAAQEIIDTNAILKVSVTLTSGEAMGVYVTDKNATGFTVKEVGNGTSNATFDWVVVVKRKDPNTPVSATVSEPIIEMPVSSGDSSGLSTTSTTETPLVIESTVISTTEPAPAPAEIITQEPTATVEPTPETTPVAEPAPVVVEPIPEPAPATVVESTPAPPLVIEEPAPATP